MTSEENSLEGMEEVILEFLVESAEGLDQMDNDLVALEAEPGNQELLANIFRTIHTIKGTCGFFGFSRLEKVSHVGENLLSRLRDGELALTPEIATALLNMVDAVREMLSKIEASNSDGEEAYAALVETLTRLKDQEATATGGDADAGPETDSAKEGSEGAEAAAVQNPRQDGARSKGNAPESPAEKRSDSESAASDDKSAGRGSLSVAESAIRVDVDVLDNLMNLVGELVLARNQILAYSLARQDPVFANACQRLNLITSELQQDVMKTRMQPISNIWNKFPRVVRDLSRTCGKQVRVEMEGKDTELDKSLIEAMKDPLTHLIRNAVDHGIEPPDTRLANGKPAEGRILLNAYHAGGQVIIEISDDGAGIDLDAVRKKATGMSLITSAQASQMHEGDLARLIFAPGMTTSKKVTNISGRGVGMDVVRANLEKIGGFIELDSVRGRGSTFRIQLPLTLAIVPALLVCSADERFAIPQGSILELIRLHPGNSEKGIETIQGVPVFRLRGKLLPLVYLNAELELDDAGRQADAMNIVVLQADQKKFGLIVDTVEDSTEIVVKPLSNVLKAIPVYAGATITGNGKVALILDVLGLAQRARLLSEHQERFLDVNATSAVLGEDDERQPLIITSGKDGGRIAIPVESVVRLEEFKRATLEQAGTRTVVQYRGKVLPLVNLTDLLQERRRKPRPMTSDGPDTADEIVHAIVYSIDGNPIGLVVDRILDILEHSKNMQGPPTRKGTLGTIVTQGQVTEVFDATSLQREFAAPRQRKRAASAGG